MSKGMNSRHMFVVFKNKSTHKQIFYAFGHNNKSQQGYSPIDEFSGITESHAPVKVSVLNELFQNIEITQITIGCQHYYF